MKEQIKELRINIDGLAQLTKELCPVKVAIISGYKNSREIDKVVDSLYLAKAWLGKVLGELGVESPYPKDGTRKTIKDIEPTADVVKKIEFPYTVIGVEKPKELCHIEKVDWLREEINRISIKVEDIDTKGQCREFSIARTNAYNYLCEARFHLGFELQRIKEEHESNS